MSILIHLKAVPSIIIRSQHGDWAMLLFSDKEYFEPRIHSDGIDYFDDTSERNALANKAPEWL
jgi:hypothetical protein